MKLRFFVIIFGVIFAPMMLGLSFTDVFSQSDNYDSTGNDYVPYTQNYNVRFNSDGQIDYDLLIMKIMPEIFEKKLGTDYDVRISQSDIVLNRGPQLGMYQESSSVCGYVLDYSDNQVYWLRAGINSTHIRAAEISIDTPTPNSPPGFEIEEYNLGWCFGPLKEQVAALFLEDKSYLTESEEEIVVAAIKHEIRGNPTLGNQEFTVGKFNFDYGKNTISFCGEFERENGIKYFGGTLKNNILKDFHLESNLSPLCAISDDAEIYPVQFVRENVDPSLEEWKNIRMEQVYLKSESIEKLLERNYMYSKNMYHNMFEYSTSFKIKHIEFMPSDSSTIWNFDKTTKDTFAKIRVPQNGGNYYMSYGPNDWNAGDLVSVIVLVDGAEVDHKEQSYIRSPYAPYPQPHTDYTFKVPKESTTITVVLFIENYTPEEYDSDEYQPYTPNYNDW